MFSSLEDRVERVIDRLVRGRRLPPRGLAEADLEPTAALLAAMREPEPRMSAGLRRRLARQLAAEPEPSPITRRTALGAAAGLVAGALGATALERFGATSSAARRAAVAAGIMRPAGGAWVPVAQLSELSEAGPVRVVAGEMVAYLFRSGDSVRAVSAICSHLPCALSWQAADSLLNCPCHNVNFTDRGVPAGSGYEIPALPSIEARVRGGFVEILSG